MRSSGCCKPYCSARVRRYTHKARRVCRQAPPGFSITMTLTQSLLIIGLLIAASAFFSVAEISLAAARRLGRDLAEALSGFLQETDAEAGG